MPLYDEPVWKLMHRMAREWKLDSGRSFRKEEALEWFNQRYPKIKPTTIAAHLIRLSTNAPSRLHYNAKPGDDDLFFQINGSTFRLYRPGSDPTPIYDQPFIGKSDSDVKAVKQKQPGYERELMQRLKDAERRIAELQAENEKLQVDQPTTGGGLDIVIADQVLRDRISRLKSAPSDTIIREAGVILENRLRSYAGDKSKVGISLVDDVLSNQGRLRFSDHEGEQEGVRMLYRGAVQFIRNPPMHKLIEYPERTAWVLLRMIDSLLVLLSEAAPAELAAVRRMLKRARLSPHTLKLLAFLNEKYPDGYTYQELATLLGLRIDQLAGVLGSLGRRVHETPGLEGKGGIDSVIEITEPSAGIWFYKLRPILVDAMKLENIGK